MDWIWWIFLIFSWIGLEEIPLQCPHEGVFGYPHPKSCDEYFQCTNGTMTHEFCPNGLLFSQTGHVVGMCAYYWNVDCGDKTVRKFGCFH